MRATLLLMLFLCAGSLSCQTYQSGLQEGITRVDDTAVVAALRTISVAQRTYSVTNGGEFATLEQLVQGGFLDSRFKSGNPVNDYNFQLVVKGSSSSGTASFSCNADPVDSKAGRHFYIDSTSNQIHVNSNKTASASDETIP